MVNDRFNLCKSSSAFMQCQRRESNHIKDKRGLNSKIHLVVNEYVTPINFIVIDRLYADCKGAIHLIKNISAKLVFENRAYGTNEILYYLNKQNMTLVIPPKPTCLHRRDYKDFKVLKKRDNSFILNFIVPII